MGIHDGHRERMREQLKNGGLESFSDVQVLELMLGYCIPRRDTNPIAHALLERFGTLAGVMDADMEELCLVDGIGENAAAFLTLLPALFGRYARSRAERAQVLDTVEKVGKYLVPFFLAEPEECAYLVCLDAQCHLLDCRKLSDGSLNTVGISIRKVVELAIRHRAVSVILAHNHVAGSAKASREDIETTERVRAALEPVGVLLADHIIVHDRSYTSMLEAGYLKQG